MLGNGLLVKDFFAMAFLKTSGALRNNRSGYQLN